jgi:4-amino-4-deoxy-L-arabinose transferase-like glycosyltransferase
MGSSCSTVVSLLVKWRLGLDLPVGKGANVIGNKYARRILVVFVALFAAYLAVALVVLEPVGYYGTPEESGFTDPWIERVETILSGGLLYRDVFTTTPPLINFLLIPPVLLSGLFDHQYLWATVSFMAYYSIFNLFAAYALLYTPDDRKEGYRSALIFLLNPLTFGNSLLRRQDESILVFFLALAVLFFVHRRPAMTGVAMGLGSLVKLTGAPLIPVAFLQTRDWRYLVIPALVFALVFAPFLIVAGRSAVFWDVTQRDTEHPFQFAGISLGHLWSRAHGGESPVSLAAYSALFVVGVLVILAIIAWRPLGLLEDLALLLTTIFLLTAKLHCGYFSLLVLALAPLVRKHRIGGLYFLSGLVILLADLHKSPLDDYSTAFNLMVVGFLLLVAAMVVIRRSRRADESGSGETIFRLPGRGWMRVAYWVLWGVVIALYVVWPLAHLNDYLWTNDEGLYMQRAALANAGYPLYTEIYLNKPPLLAWILQSAFLIAGPTVTIARLTALCLTLVGFVATAIVARQLWSKWAGLTAAGVLLALPEVPIRAHVVMADLPALALALVAMAAALRFRRGGWRGWVALSGVAFAGALLIHPLLVYMALPLAIVLFWPAGKSWRRIVLLDVLIFVGAAAVAGLLVLGAVDRRAFFHWVFQFNYGAGADLLEPQKNWQRIAGYLKDVGPLVGLSALSAAALGLSPRERRPLSIAVVWWLATVAILMVSSPLQKQYLLFLAFPLAVIAGGGLVAAGGWVLAHVQGGRLLRGWRAVLALLMLIGVVLLVVNRWEETKPCFALASEWSADHLAARAFLERQVSPGGLVATDDPFLAFAAGRLVPPSLTELSTKQIKVGNLMANDVEGAILWYRAQAVLFSTNRLERLPGLEDWVASVATERRDFGELRAYRLDLPPSVSLSGPARLGSEIRLSGYALSGNELRPGETLAVMLLWQCETPPSADYHVFVHLVDEEGRVWGQHDGPPAMGSRPTSQWMAGQRVFDVHPVGIEQIPPGEYHLHVGMYGWPSLERLSASCPDGSRCPNDQIVLTESSVVVP